MIKVAIVGQSYMFRAARQRLVELCKNPDLELSLVTPERYKFPWINTKCEPPTKDETFTHHRLKIFPLTKNSEGRSIYLGLGGVLRQIDPDIVHIEQGADAVALFQVLVLKKLLKLRYKTLFYTWVNTDNSLKSKYFLLDRCLRLIERYNFGNVASALCGNVAARAILKDRGFGKRIDVFPHLGIDLTVYRRYDVGALKSKLKCRGFVIGFVGQIISLKGVYTLLNAVYETARDRGRPITLLIVGNGDLKDELKRISEQNTNPLLNIIVHDAVAHFDVPKYMSCMDVLVLPSLKGWAEQLGHVIIEAMACGVPVIGSTSGNIPHVIGDAGLVFHQGDVWDLAEKLTRVIENPGLAADLSRRGLERVRRNYIHEIIAEKTYTVYRETVAGR